MFYDTFQYHMIEVVIFPGQFIVGENEPVNHVYFMVKGTASVEIKLDGEIHQLEVLK
jgi:hypothetical protein